MADVFTCKNCWKFHVIGASEQGTCRAPLTPVKTNRNDICIYPKDFTSKRIVASYSIVDKRGNRIDGITNINVAIEMFNESNEQARKDLLNYRKGKK